jgi:thiol-disulfide isomerase/thioredoxin
VALAAVALLVATGCSASKNAVNQDSSYVFVAPGGKTQLFYDPPDTRGKPPKITGNSLTAPETQIGPFDYPGQVVVVNIWGSWCAPCRAEAPELEQVYRQTRTSGVQLLGIDVRDTQSAAQDFVYDYGITYPSIFDPPARSLLVLQGYPRNVVPSTLVLDREHRVAAVFLQPMTAAQLLPVVQRIVTEKTTTPTTTTPAAP